MEEIGLVSSKPREGRSNLYVIPPTPTRGVEEEPPTPARGTPLTHEGVPPSPMRGVSPIYTTLNEPLKNGTMKNVNPQPYSGDPLPSDEQQRRAQALRQMLEKGVKQDEETDFDFGTDSGVSSSDTTESNTGS
jgi:hypothetical protein